MVSYYFKAFGQLLEPSYMQSWPCTAVMYCFPAPVFSVWANEWTANIQHGNTATLFCKWLR